MTLQLYHFKLMNFDTRTIIDLIKLNDNLKNDMLLILEEERSLIKKTNHKKIVDDNTIKSDIFFENTIPQLKDCLKSFLKSGLNGMNLLILRGIININNVDYLNVVTVLTH